MDFISLYSKDLFAALWGTIFLLWPFKEKFFLLFIVAVHVFLITFLNPHPLIILIFLTLGYGKSLKYVKNL